ncbi:MAG: sulfur oxidation c-type cytochrome SoxA, partial [Betaproteobacteria bacterium]
MGPEQDRQALIHYLEGRLPGTRPKDWSLGADGLAPTSSGAAQPIPFNAENATNSADILAIGKKLWDRRFKNGKSFANCFPNAGKRVAVTYPQYDAKAKLIITLEMAINRCLQLHREPEIEMQNVSVTGPLSAYARSLSEGQRLALRVGVPAARDKLESGKALFTRRIGQQNFACASCHVLQAGNVLGPGMIDV